MSVYDLAYLAGLFDGEGCIAFNYRRQNGPRGKSPILIVSSVVKMTDEDTVRLFHDRWPGSFSVREYANPRWSPTWTWQVAALKAKAFLEEIRPHLRLKRPQAELALAYYETIDRSRTLTPEGLVERLAFRDRMRELNRRGPEGAGIFVGR